MNRDEYLPAKISIPTELIRRTHSPTERHPRKRLDAWKDYIRCLRWDFEFQCPFCLLHEADLSEVGVEGQGLATVEHLVGQAEDPCQKNEYSNTYFACRFCNIDRGKHHKAKSTQGKILRPDQDIWSQHFRWRDSYFLHPCKDSYNEIHTLNAYKPNKLQKVARRRIRRETIEEARKIIEAVPEYIRELESRVPELLQGDATQLKSTIKQLRFFKDRLKAASRSLQRYRRVPIDAPETCRCGLRAPSTQGSPR